MISTTATTQIITIEIHGQAKLRSENGVSTVDNESNSLWNSPTVFSQDQSIHLPQLEKSPTTQVVRVMHQEVQQIANKSQTLQVPQLEIPASNRNHSNAVSQRSVLKTPVNESDLGADEEKEIYNASRDKSLCSRISKSNSEHNEKTTLSPSIEEEKEDDRGFAQELKQFILPLCNRINSVFGDVVRHNYVASQELRFFRYLFALNNPHEQEQYVHRMIPNIIRNEDVQKKAIEIIQRFLNYRAVQRSSSSKKYEHPALVAQEPVAPPVLVPMPALNSSKSAAKSICCSSCCVIM